MSLPRPTLALLLLVLSCSLVPAPAPATTTNRVDVACPVCLASFTAPQLMSTNSFGGQDTDFMVRARGTQPLLVAPITCVACGYSGYLDDFDRAGPPPASTTPPADDALKTAIRQEKRLQLPVPLPATDTFQAIPPWGRYDLIAQVYQLQNRDERTIARQWQNAAWAVRLDQEFFLHGLADEQRAAMEKALNAAFAARGAHGAEAFGGNQAMFEVDVADSLLASGPADPGTMLGAFFLLRMHGENTAARTALDRLKPLLTPEQASAWETRFTADLERERSFQTKAAEGLAKAAEAADHPAEKAAIRYHAGELYRRLEQWDKARALFDQARSDPNLPDFVKGFLAFVEKRLPQS
ncbi:MAG: DUF2225 domain-containing protein [Candidatus Riflebacteria bacterium]|nr:DUF2225 domain-containing protein [Candidatus Riflebacteria bacterium]